MSTKTQADSLDFLKCLLQQLQACETDFPSPDYLERLQIQAIQVDLADNQTLQFDPCFFQPHPEGILHKYEAVYDKDKRMPRLSIPTLAQVLEEIQEDYPNNKDILRIGTREEIHEDEEILRIATSQHERLIEWSKFDDWYHDAQGVYNHVNWQLTTLRKGGPYSHLEDLVPQEYCWYTDRKGDPPTVVLTPYDRRWGVLHHYRYSQVEGPIKPHSVMACIAHARPDVGKGPLTIFELQAIVGMMILRVSRIPFRKFRVHPVLAFCYLGKRARIIQAFFDGKILNLQYSRVWAFEDENTAPTELFVRYHLSQPVGLESSTLYIR